MKKLFIIIAIIGLSVPVVYAADGIIKYAKAYNRIAPGLYTCPESPTACEFLKGKDGSLEFYSESCKEDPDSEYSVYVPMIQRGQCSRKPDPNRYYYCIFSDALCEATKTGSSELKVSCMQKDKNKKVSEQSKSAAISNIEKFISKNLCIPKFSPEGQYAYKEFVREMQEINNRPVVNNPPSKIPIPVTNDKN